MNITVKVKDPPVSYCHGFFYKPWLDGAAELDTRVLKKKPV